MADDATTPPGNPLVRDGEGDISAELVAATEGAIAAEDADGLRRIVGELHEADLADLIEALEPEARTHLIRLLGDEFDFTALTEVDDTIREQILEDLPPEAVAEGVRDLDSDDAVSILEDLDPEERNEILDQLPPVERVALARSLEFPEDSAGRLMQTDFIAVPPFWTVGQVIDHLREADDLPDEFYQLFVVDPGYRLIGTVALDKLLRSKRPTPIPEITDTSPQRIRATEDQEAVARLFERYNLVSAAVIDEADRLVGVITVDDIVDVIEEEADEDIRRLAGVGDEEVSDTVGYVARSRLPWLLLNIATAFLAAGVISLFGGTIEQMVALAALMPIVASMGGNAGTQAMTVTVRAIATREIGLRRARRVIGREVVVALFNGAAVAACVGAGAGLWFRNFDLGAVIAVALVINIFVAGLVGSLIPLVLDRLKIDPAVASVVLLTALTDVTGFFVFLGLAGWWFGLL
jgi:magnesium transporter